MSEQPSSTPKNPRHPGHTCCARRTSRIIGIRQVATMVDLSPSTINRKIAKGSFPAKIQISRRRVGWLLADIEAWIRAKEPAPAADGAGNRVQPS